MTIQNEWKRVLKRHHRKAGTPFVLSDALAERKSLKFSNAIEHKPCLTQDKVDRLHDAMLLIADVADAMDSTSVECEACGTKRLTNWPSHQLKMKLTGIHAKLTNLLNSEWYQRKED